MRNLFIIRILSVLLCFAMAAEISTCFHYGDVISVEIDSEMEHEESSEKEKEKTTGGSHSPLESYVDISLDKWETYTDPYWNSPSIDFHTPPPELS
ncbi:hypothetical protein SAMN05421640_0052 [Ekhidna lutea]|uniref:Uncharacterized protein n=1 Tax=Ekhidna lutea TaxID=447679 RepID=A0A239ECK3_EKHLU|nr:hypothetical protein [Ekhidna lutea]SNS41674.1 hypothetical protein SAMN05421640_0052 [Ekhidna lutea]